MSVTIVTSLTEWEGFSKTKVGHAMQVWKSKDLHTKIHIA
jgi:hypothetical protein